MEVDIADIQEKIINIISHILNADCHSFHLMNAKSRKEAENTENDTKATLCSPNDFFKTLTNKPICYNIPGIRRAKDPAKCRYILLFLFREI